MKKQILYLHGGESYVDHEDFLARLRQKDIRDLPDSKAFVKWTKTLATDLGDDYEVFELRMPNSENAKYEEWKIWFERHFSLLRDDVILIGCSLGAMFFYRYLIENETPFSIKSVILMASPAPELLPKDEKDCGDFVFLLNDIKKLSERSDRIIIMHSEDDFLVPYDHAVKLHEFLPQAELVTFTDKNHFLVEELPELIEKIKEVAEK